MTDLEETETRLVLQSIQCNAKGVLIDARGTDELLMFLAKDNRTEVSDLWVMAGTSRTQNNTFVNIVYNTICHNHRVPEGVTFVTEVHCFPSKTASTTDAFSPSGNTLQFHATWRHHQTMAGGPAKRCYPPSTLLNGKAGEGSYFTSSTQVDGRHSKMCKNNHLSVHQTYVQVL